MKIRNWGGAAAALLISACTTTQMAQNFLDKSFAGKNMDEFVIKYGPPAGKFVMNNGDVMYTWNSQVNSYGLPTTTTVTGTAANGIYNGTAVTSGGGSINVYCQIQLMVGADGMIKSAKPMQDTIGKWTLSRCAEIFSDNPIN